MAIRTIATAIQVETVKNRHRQERADSAGGSLEFGAAFGAVGCSDGLVIEGVVRVSKLTVECENASGLTAN